MEPPFEVGADQVMPILVSVVTSGLLARRKGASGTYAARIVTTEESAEKPNAFLAWTLN